MRKKQVFRQDVSRWKADRSLARQFRDLKKGRRKVRNSFAFLRNLWLSKKIVEAISFGYWDLSFRLFKQKLVCFTKDSPTKPNHDWSNVSKNMDGEYPIRISSSSYNWKLLYFDSSGVGIGSLFSSPNDLHQMLVFGELIKLFRFSEEILSVFVSRQNIIFVSLGDGSVYKSTDSGLTFSKSLNLSSSESYIRLDYGFTETANDQLIIGEYGNATIGRKWKSLAHLYTSNNRGKTWKKLDFLLTQGVNKHVHMVKYSKRMDSIILTDGDNKKQIWISYRLNTDPIKWRLINKYHIQTGGYTSMVELDGGFLFGTDYHGGTNFIVQSADCEHFTKSVLPEPYKRCPIYSMVKRSADDVVEIWASLHNATSASTKSLLMFSRDYGKTWVKVIEYDGSKNRIHIVSAAREPQNKLYFCVTSLSNSGPEVPLGTFCISDKT